MSTESVSWDGVWDGSHLVGRSAAPKARRVLDVGPQDGNRRLQIGADFGDYFPFTLSVIGTLSIRLRDLTMSFVVSAYFLKCGVSKCALNASALS